MSGIEVVTQAQAARFPEFVERWRARWRAIGLCTAPTDRRAAEHVIRRCYERAGIKPPEKFIWLKPPLAGALAYDLLTVKHSIPRSDWKSIENSAQYRLRTSLRLSLWSSIRGRIQARAEASVWASVGTHVWASVGDSIRDGVGDSIRASVRTSVEASVGENRIAVNPTRGSLLVFGSYRPASWLAHYYSSFLEVCGLKVQVLERLDDLSEQARHCGWWWPFENLVIATEKPVALHLDDGGRLHHATAPAIAYGDGWSVYAWHGTRIPPQYYEQPVMAQQILQEENAEVRRALIERYGQERFFLDAGAAVLDRDPEHGAELIAIDLPGDPERRMVALKLHCPSTSAVSIVRVPPRYRKARAALAWSFGLQYASEYELAGES
jgi:hypothetical protein